jgi:molybdopterin-guanine dinucleotide biosynthesis protein A
VAARTADLHLIRDATLVILAGGRSTRMGRDKAALPVGEATLLDWMVRRLGPAFAETIVAGAAAPAGATEARDQRADSGPLAGIEAGLLAARSPLVFVVACDMPYAGVRLARFLLARCAGHEAAVPRLEGRAQPTCAVYAREAAPKISAYLDRGGKRATDALGDLDAIFVDGPELAAEGIAATELTDLDTPAEYEAFIASLRA